MTATRNTTIIQQALANADHAAGEMPKNWMFAFYYLALAAVLALCYISDSIDTLQHE